MDAKHKEAWLKQLDEARASMGKLQSVAGERVKKLLAERGERVKKCTTDCEPLCDFCDHFWPLARMEKGVSGAPPVLVYWDGSGKCVHHDKEVVAEYRCGDFCCGLHKTTAGVSSCNAGPTD